MGSWKLVLGLWCSRLLGRQSRGPGAGVVGAERAPPHPAAPTPDPHGDTQKRTEPETAAAGATKEPGTQRVPAGREGACGRVRLRRA